MRNIRRLSAALAVASAAFVLAAPATQASAAAAGASPAASSTIDVTNGQFSIIVPNSRAGKSVSAPQERRAQAKVEIRCRREIRDPGEVP